eukprot:gene15006-4465_t
MEDEKNERRRGIIERWETAAKKASKESKASDRRMSDSAKLRMKLEKAAAVEAMSSPLSPDLLQPREYSDTPPLEPLEALPERTSRADRTTSIRRTSSAKVRTTTPSPRG